MSQIAVAVTADRCRDDAALAWATGWADRRGGQVTLTRLFGPPSLPAVVVAGVMPAGRTLLAIGPLLDRARATGSTVVLVPADAQPAELIAEDERPIVLGASSSPAGRAALAFAVREAIGESRPLEVVRVWPDPGLRPVSQAEQGRPGVSGLCLSESWRTEPDDDVAVLGDILTRARALRPLLAVSGELRTGQPAPQLCRAADDAQLLVIGAAAGGQLATALLKNLVCPLVVTAVGPRRPEPASSATSTPSSARRTPIPSALG